MAAQPIDIPFNWDPRIYQQNLFYEMDPLQGNKKRGCLVWHRRAGKDTAALHFTNCEAHERIGNYWHLFPKQTQARKAIWKGINREGEKIIDSVFPPPLRAKALDQEMMIEFKCGSTWQLCGSDNYDSLVGSNPVGVIFSEWPLCDPAAWDYIRPILLENNGWALFIYTPRGKNHGYTMYRMAKDNPDWYCELLSVDDTSRDDGTPVMTPAMIQSERDEGMSEELIQQEYYCSFDAQIPGAVYAEEMRRVHADKRICRIPIDPALDVHTFWDLGVNKLSGNMAIWFVQATGQEIRLVDFYQNHSLGMSHYVNYLKEWAQKYGTHYGKHYAPHDIGVFELGAGKTRKQTALDMGIKFIPIPKINNVSNGIESTRRIFPRLWFDEDRCEGGINAVSSYHYEFNEKTQQYTTTPVHDWSSDAADALRQIGQAWKDSIAKPHQAPQVHHADTSFNPLG